MYFVTVILHVITFVSTKIIVLVAILNNASFKSSKWHVFLSFVTNTVTGADPGFVVRVGVSRRGVWGPLTVPSWSRVEAW